MTISVKKRALLGLLTTLITLLLAELFLALASWRFPVVERVLAAPWQRAAIMVSDAELGNRGNPLHWEHDASGYRNPRRLDRAAIVTLGDSQTYGTSVARADSWPFQLAVLTGATVYNMAVPSYGPAHNLLQLEEALALHPGLIIIGVYFGNDLYDSFMLSRSNGKVAALVSPAMAALSEKLEKEAPLGIEVMRLFSRGESSQETEVSNVRAWVAKHSKLYALVRSSRYLLFPQRPSPLLSQNFEEIAKRLTPVEREFVSVFSDGDWQTILTARYRGRVLDTTDPRIRQGFEVTRTAMRRINERSRVSGVKLLVVLIPTKESVFWPRVSDPEAHPGLLRLVEAERSLKNVLIADMKSLGIEFVDVLGSMRKAERNPYFENVDGHPNVLGHKIIATEIAVKLSRGG